MEFQIVRVLRTASSERFVLHQSGKDFPGLDLHYLAGGAVAGTLTLFEGSGVDEKQVPDLLKKIDETLLPEVSIEEGMLSFTDVCGRVVGSFMPGAVVHPQ